jgi:transcriptional regulator with XRE-family HTH domain
MATSDTNLRHLFTLRLRDARRAAGLSQRELGRRIGLTEDVVHSRVARYELETSEPDFATTQRLAQELGVPVAYLLADTEALAQIVLAAAVLSPSKQRKLATELATLTDNRKRSDSAST